MNGFSYWCSTKVLFGEGTASRVGSEVKAFGGKNVLVLYGQGSVIKSGLLDTVMQSLNAEGIRYECVGGIQPNPLSEFAQQVVDDFKDLNIDFVLAVGGGSVIDTAKTVALGLKTPDTPLWDIMCGKVVAKDTLPVGSILTIAAAGSETSNATVLTNKGLGHKRVIRSEVIQPVLAIMDPELTYGLPSYQIACGATDILMHTLDRYFAPDADNAVTDELSEALMRMIVKYGRESMENPNDYKARSELMWAGSLSHNGLTGLGQTLEFSVHQLALPMSAKYDTAHGASLAAIWPAWARYVCSINVPRFARYAREVWGVTERDDEAAAKSGIAETEAFFRSIGMPVTMTEAEGESVKNDIDALAELCSFNRSRTIGAIKVLDFEEMKSVYSSAL